jgi:hypothetical protein
MNYRLPIVLLSVLTLGMSIQLATTAGADETVYGYQLMTEQERAEHRAKMRSFNTDAEREAYRRQHHEMMQQRARAQGVTLPDEPMPRGQGRGMGKGQGMGMGQGYRGGQGQGQGQASTSEQ